MNAITYSRIKKMSPQLSVTNIERSIEFYTKKLGFNVDFRYEDFYAGIIKDGYSIHLKVSRCSMLQRESEKGNEGLDVLFSVDDIESLYQELSGESIAFTQSLRNMPYGKEFYVEDPDGNIIAFLEEA